MFVPHPIEEKYKNRIKIQDKAFDETFVIFKKYDWNLQGKEGKSDNEISPDVMGYIFEKYINELQQKSLGAYYTRDEITNYLSRNTIQKCILEKVNSKGYKFETIVDMLHKMEASLCKFLLTDEDSILNTLTVLDPAVGSGAFLISAMKELIDIYSPIIGKIETLGDRDLKNWLTDFKVKHKSVLYGIKKNIILKNLYGVDIMKEATEVCKLRLFLSLVSSTLKIEELEPLPNMDFNIMCGNSLIGFLREEEKKKESAEQFEWDAVLGESYQQIQQKYNKLVSQYKNKALSFEKLKELKHKISDFLNKNNSKLNNVLADKCNKDNLKYSKIINIQGKKKLTKTRAVRAEDFYSKEDEKNLKPFHWNFAFNEIVNKGGFDIIITNPPWDKIELEDREFFYKYDKSIDKKKTKKEIIKKKKQKLLKKPAIKQDYLKTEEFYIFQREYFLKFYNHQRGRIIDMNGKEKKSPAKNIDNYRLFTERCFSLLNQKGFVGIVLPSGLHKDDGSIGLRRELLFSKVKIEGLIDFQNQMNNGKGKIFGGVDSRFKFLLLNLKKDKPQDIFPCQFMERDLKILDENGFPKNCSMEQSIKEIKELSPRDCSVIEFKNLKDKKILKKAIQFSEIGKTISSLWNPYIYTGEFNETHHSNLFEKKKISENYLPLYPGKAIWQYKFNHDLSHVNRYVNLKSKDIHRKGFPFKNKCYKNYRLVIRDVARNTDERSLISAIIPKNSFISNSLYGVHIAFGLLESQSVQKSDVSKNGQLNIVENESKSKQINPSSTNKYMLLFQSFLNSFIVDYFIRQKISAHTNKKYIVPLHVPRLTEKDPYFKELVERSAKLTCIGREFNELADEVGISRNGITDQKERWKIQGEIDAIVAYTYGLNLDEFEYILGTFTTGKNQKRLQALKEYAIEAFKKDKFIDKSG